MKELKAKDCSNLCPEIKFECKSSAELVPLGDIIGQDRAVHAMHYGLKMKDQGFNVFITGEPGTGRKSSIGYIRVLSKDMPVPNDCCYVNNFQDSSRPKFISVPPGTGKEFKKEMERFRAGLVRVLQNAFESEEYGKRREGTVKQIEAERTEILNKANEMAHKTGFMLQPSPVGLNIIPLTEGRPLTNEEMAALPPVLQKEIDLKRQELEVEIRKFLRPLRDLARKAEDLLTQLNREVADVAVDPLLERIREMFKGNKDLEDYLKSVENDVIENLPALLLPPQQQPGVPPGMPLPDPLRNYHVNLVVDNSDLTCAPTVIENNPTYNHLFGYSEKEIRYGAMFTDYSMARAGEAHRANGGFLVIDAEKLFTDPFAYPALKQTIQTKKLAIEEPAARFDFIVTKSLRPEPIPFDCKIVLVGTPRTYLTLYSLDPEFRELFKVRADFDTSMERNDENIDRYASFVCMLSNKENLRHLDPKALAAVIDYSSRLAEDKEKLSTQFSVVADMIREANFYAGEDGSELITKMHIKKQLEEKEYRSNMIQEKIDEMIQKGTILVDTDGEVAGQVNGLAVLQLGDYMFGRPSRITASAGVGREGVIDIERQAEMGGPTHTKGVLIISGYLNWMYAQQHPLSLTARLVFEQSYSGVDGDSASSTELYALLSNLSGRPIKQSLAVTGSVNQRGQVQAIGGVNHKIEGYFEVCKRMGLNGKQGCLIPQSNVRHLMLKDEVIEAVKEGKFHIYPISTIDEGIEVLTGVKAGVRDKDGKFPKDTIHYLVQQRLDEMAESIKPFRA